MPTSRVRIQLAEARPPFFVGVDLGGTNIKVGLVDDDGRTLVFKTLRTEVKKGPEDAAARMGKAVLEVIDEAGLTPDAVPAVGLGTPGTMDIPAGMMLEPPNLSGWRNVPIRAMLSRHCGKPVTFANDAGAAAFGEYWCGSGRHLQSLVLLTLGTGIGGGIIIDNLSIDGHHSHGAEVGHIIIDYRETARLCSCGATGHLEGYVGAPAVVRRTQEALADGRQSSITAQLDAGAKLTPRLLAEQAEAGDALALELILDTACFLGVGIVSLLNTIDPEGVVLGGAMTFGGSASGVGRQFLDRIRQEVRARAFPVLAEQTVIDFASLGGDAGYIGAAGLARASYHRS
ncbi:MAG: glucokinase [Planctomycetes bacterium RBG_16_64_10]|nr:MAG: glucokinase [Planctomycetes bacterium RBG_16_64_10]